MMNKNLKKLTAYQVKILPEGLKRLHANESAEPILPIEILQKDVFENINYYPEKQLLKLNLEAENFYKIEQKYITPTNGSDEGLDLIIRALCGNKGKCVVLNPTFSMYELFATAHGLRVSEFDLNEKDFTLDITRFIKFCLHKKPQVVFIPNPIAPTASKISKDDIIKIITTLPQSLIVVDEAYIEFSKQESMLPYVKKYKNLIVTRTLSKFFGLAGLRVGFVFSNYKEEINKIKTPYNISAISAKVAINLLQNIDEKIIADKFQKNEKNKASIINWLKGFEEVEEIYESHSNFIFFRTKNEGNIFAEKLLNQGLKIKSFSHKFKNFCRITIE